jgi:DNA-binding XRE family transcriptional regulator
VSRHDKQVEDHESAKDPWPDIWVVGPDEADNRRFGRLLESLRWKARLSRAEAAQKIGLSSEYLRLIEVGKRAPALGQMRKVLDVYGADGEVEKVYPEGYRQDLIVLDPLNGEPVVVEFTSRIREARRKALGGPPDEDEHTSQTDGRTTEIGRVVLLLTRADDDTLKKVRELLERAGSGALAE